MRTHTLGVALLAALLVLAGCSGSGGTTTTAPNGTVSLDASNPATTATPGRGTTTTPGPGQSGNGTALDPRTAQDRQFLQLAAANNVTVTAAFTNNNTLNVAYVVESESPASASRRGFLLAQAYATVVNDTWRSNASWNATVMEATAVTQSGRPVASYRMPAYWGRRVRSTEIFTESWLARRIDKASSRVYKNGSIGNVSRNLSQFAAGISKVQNGTVQRITRRGGTVFLTLETRTNNQSLLKKRFGRIVYTYGLFAFEGWDAERIELEVVRPDGDVYGWYNIKRKRALNAYRNRANVPVQFAFDTFYAEDDRLDG